LSCAGFSSYFYLCVAARNRETKFWEGCERKLEWLLAMLLSLLYSKAASDDMVVCSWNQGDGDEDVEKLAFQPAARFGPIMDQVHNDLVSRQVAQRVASLQMLIPFSSADPDVLFLCRS
jgi:hypothetical protein